MHVYEFSTHLLHSGHSSSRLHLHAFPHIQYLRPVEAVPTPLRLASHKRGSCRRTRHLQEARQILKIMDHHSPDDDYPRQDGTERRRQKHGKFRLETRKIAAGVRMLGLAESSQDQSSLVHPFRVVVPWDLGLLRKVSLLLFVA